jgi:ATP-binding cassette subfamily B (MDR/TAP) protein 1
VLTIYGKAGQLAEEVFSTMRTVHAFWLNDLLSRKYDAMLKDAMNVGMKKSPIYSVLFSTEFFCIFCGYALAFWQGIRMYANGTISESGDVITVIFAVIAAATAMTTIAPQVITLANAASAAEKLFKTIDRQSEIDPLSNQGEVPLSCAGQIHIENVNFAYPTRVDVPVLKQFSLSVPANSTTALVGQSGSGKSTIVGLLGMYPSVNRNILTQRTA